MLLASTSSTIEVKLAYAKTTNHLPVTASYADNDNTGGTYTPGMTATNTNNTTAVTVVSSPGSGVQRTIKHMTVHNADTVMAFVYVTYFDGSTRFDEQRVALNPKDTLVFTSLGGWYVVDNKFVIRSTVYSSGYLPAIRRNVGYIGNAATTSKTLTTNTTFAVYLGKADRDFSSVKVLYRVNIAAVTITWAEIAIATGAFTLGGNASLTLAGTASNVAAVINSTGLKTTTVSASGKVGDDLWILYGNQASTIAQFQCGLANANQDGWQQTAAVRPSSMAAPTSFTLEGTAVRPASFVYQLL